MHSLLVEAILEDIFSDLVKKFPDQETNLLRAKKRGVKPKYFQWLAKMLHKTMEPVEDIIPVINAFDQKQNQIKAKFGGNSGDINSYQTIADLSDRLESLSSGSSSNPGGEIVYEDPTWLVVFPRTTEESCASGKNTSWCTARTQSSNLFLSYTGRNDGIFLFYVINKTQNPRTDPNAKVSIGFHNGQPVFNNQDGGMTVNSKNEAVSHEQFQALVGPENAAKFLELMRKKVEAAGGKHPASAELEQLAQDPAKFLAKVNTFKHEEEKEDFLSMIMDLPRVSPGVLQWFMNDYDGKRALLDNSNIVHTTPEMLAQLATDEARDVRVMVAKNKKTPVESLKRLAEFDDARINYALANNPNAGEALTTLFYTESEHDSLEYIILNPSAPPALLRKIYQTYSNTYYVVDRLATNERTPPDVLQDIVANQNKYGVGVSSNAYGNPNYPKQ